MGELKKWLKQKWVRIGTDGSILGPCGTSKNKKNPDRCLLPILKRQESLNLMSKIVLKKILTLYKN
mgnify:CR=1 FL=1